MQQQHGSERNLARDRFRTPTGEVVPLVRDKHGPTFERWLGKGGHLTLRWKGAGIVHVVVRDHGDGRFANPMLRSFDAQLDRYGKISIFCDFERMPSYDPPLRTALTEWCQERKDEVRTLQILVGSKIVMMGITIANLALEGFIQPHVDRRTFDQAMRRGV